MTNDTVKFKTVQGVPTATCLACGNTAAGATREESIALLHAKPCRGSWT